MPKYNISIPNTIANALYIRIVVMSIGAHFSIISKLFLLTTDILIIDIATYV